MKLPDNAEKLNRDIWVSTKENGHQLSFQFLEFASSDMDDTNIEVDIIMHGYGYIELRECRHTYWGEEGYIYYPNTTNLRAILDWIDKHFDIN
jgi:hypothetical protein